MFTVYFAKTPNMNVGHFQNQNRYIGSRGFKTLEEANAFAANVQVKGIYSPAGKKIA